MLLAVVTLGHLLKTSSGPGFLICEVKFIRVPGSRDLVRVSPKDLNLLLVHGNKLSR